MLDNRNAWSWMGFAMVGGLLLLGAYLMTGNSTKEAGLRVALALCGSILSLAGIINLVDWTVEMALDRMHQARLALAITPETRMIDRIGTLTAEQCKLLRDEALVIRQIAGSVGPLYYLVLPGDHEVPMTFVRLFFQLSSGGYLAAIRTWPEGTIQRENATALTHFLVIHGYADTARGNQPARWLDRRGALKQMGLDEMDVEEESEIEEA